MTRRNNNRGVALSPGERNGFAILRPVDPKGATDAYGYWWPKLTTLGFRHTTPLSRRG